MRASRQLLEVFCTRGEVSLGLEDSSANIWLFSYRDDFGSLWGMLDDDSFLEELITGDQQHTITVVWDGIPPRGEGAALGTSVDTGEYLSSLDWAMAFSLTIDDKVCKSNLQTYPPIKILILDLASHTRRNAPASQFFNLFPKRDVKLLPWIRLYGAVGGENAWSFLDLIRDVSDSDMPSMRESLTSQNDLQELETIQRIWAAGITKPAKADDHHAIANLIGPMLLMDDSFHPDVHIQALNRLLNSIKARQEDIADEYSDNLLSAKKLWINWDEEYWKGKLHRLGGGNKKIKLLLLDDQWLDGWGEVICKAVGAPFALPEEPQLDQFVEIGSVVKDPAIVVKACGSAKWLAGELERKIQEKPDHRFKLQLDNEAEGQEILLLDLRLFSGKSPRVEAEFILKLLQLAERYQEREDVKLPWSGFTRDELERIRGWVDRAEELGRDNLVYREALTLFPRIISLMDLSYPIILFSSTGRREIVDKFKEYGNIITNFEKPRLIGATSTDLASQAKANFQHAMDYSFAMLQSRNRCLAFFNAKDPYEKVDKPRVVEGQSYHIELYIDETDPKQSMDDRATYRKGWRVGGCFALFDGDTENRAREKSDQFEDILVKNGVRYFEWASNGVQPAQVIQSKSRRCAKKIIGALENAEQENCKPLCIGAASLYQCAPEGRDKNMDLLDPRHDDQLFLTTLSAFVEAFLYESVPALTDGGHPSISLFAATRINAIEDRKTDNKSVKIARRERYKAGVGWQPAKFDERGGGIGTGVVQDTFREDDFAPLVRNIIRSRNNEFRIRRALAIQLPYAERDQKPKSFVCRQCKSEIATFNDAVYREKILDQIKSGQIFKGSVKSAHDYGFFVEIYPGIQGLVPNSEVLLSPMIEVGGHYCGTIMRKISSGVLVDFGANSWGKLSNVVNLQEGDSVGVELKRISKNNQMGKIFYDLELLENVPEIESAADIMRIGSDHLVKVVNKDSDNKLRLSRTKAFGKSEDDVTKLQYPPITCAICSSSDSVYPDSRALHYVADQILTDMFGNGARKYEKVFGKLVPGEFEEGWDEEFPAVLEASRTLDVTHCDIPKAVSTFPLDAKRVCVESDGKNTKPAIRNRVKWRIGRSLENIDGNTFINIMRRSSVNE